MKKLFISLMVAALLTISTVAVASANHGENHKAVPQSGDGCDRSSCQILWKFPSRLIADQSAAVAIP